MNTDGRQLFLSVLAVILSLILVSGSMLLSVVEGGMVAVVPTSQFPTHTATEAETPPTPTENPEITPFKITPGEITLTLLPPTATFTFSPTATETLLPPTNCPPPIGWQAIMTAPGDTLEDLAGAYGTTVEALMQANCLLISQLIPGTRLYVPPFSTPTPLKTCGPPAGWVRYVVQPGDTLYRLSLMFKVSVYTLQEANCLSSSRIQAGQVIYVPNLPTWTPITPPATPSGTPTPTRTPTPTVPTAIPTTAVPTAVFTPTPTQTATATPTMTPTATATNTNTPVPTPTDTPEPTATTQTPVLRSEEQKQDR